MTESERRVVTTVEELREYIGKEINVSPWVDVTQERVDQFADATGDHQYIDIDPERAKETFFGGTIAHGYMTLSTVYAMGDDTDGITINLNGKLSVNYGLNKVRFPAPSPVGKRVRQRVVLVNVEEIGDQAVQMTYSRTIEVEGSDKPACVAETLSRVYW